MRYISAPFSHKLPQLLLIAERYRLSSSPIADAAFKNYGSAAGFLPRPVRISPSAAGGACVFTKSFHTASFRVRVHRREDSWTRTKFGETFINFTVSPYLLQSLT